MDQKGGFVAAWTSAADAFAQRFDAQGNKVGPEFRVNGTTYDGQGPGDVVVLPSGDFLVTWGSWQDTNGTTSVFMRRYSFPASLAIAPGKGPSNPPEARVTQPDGLATRATIPAYGAPGYGANVGAGDIDGPALDEVLTGPGPSPVFGPQVRAFRADGSPIQKVNFYAYGTLRYGVKPAGGNTDADAYSEVLTAPGPGAAFGPHIRGWNYDNATLQPNPKVSFFAFSTLAYGANVAAGDVDGDGYDELLAGAGPSPAFWGQVRGFNVDGGAATAIAKINFYAYTWIYGANVASSDVESDGVGGYGDGYDEIVTGRGPGPANGTDFRLWDYDGASVSFKYETSGYSSAFGVIVAGGDVDAGDTEEVVTAPGPDPSADAHILCWEWEPGVGTGWTGLDKLGPDDFVTFMGPPQLFYGANVAVGTFQ